MLQSSVKKNYMRIYIVGKICENIYFRELHPLYNCLFTNLSVKWSEYLDYDHWALEKMDLRSLHCNA